MLQRLSFFLCILLAIFAISYVVSAQSSRTQAMQHDPGPSGALNQNQALINSVQNVPITIRTHYNAVAGLNPTDGTQWPRLAIFVNNGGNFQQQMDTADCTKDDRPATCGTPNLFADKRVDDFVAEGNSTHDTIVNSRDLLLNIPGTNELISKLSFAYYNDYWNPATNPVTDRGIYIRKVEFLDPNGNVILEYTPQSTGNTNFYYNMGVLNMEGVVTAHQNGMNRAFDRGPFLFIDPQTGQQTGEEPELLFPHNHPDFNSVSQNRWWALEREGSFNIVTRELASALQQDFSNDDQPSENDQEGPQPPIGPGMNPFGGVGGNDTAMITIRTHFQAQAGLNPSNNTQWPQVALFLNNGGNFDGDRDFADCTVADRPATCGTPNAFQDKMLENIEVSQANYMHETIVPASEMPLALSATDNITKLSYVYHNDYWNPGLTVDRDVFITRVEVVGPDGKVLANFTPQTQIDPQPLAQFYFNMGVVNIDGTATDEQNGMNNAFDQELVFVNPALLINQDETDFTGFEANRWALTREGSFNIVSRALGNLVVSSYPGTTTPTQPPSSDVACVLSTNNTGGTQSRPGLHLPPGTDLVVHSTATVPIKEFHYAVYNQENLNADGIFNPLCITGMPATDNCPAGTGQLIFKVTESPGPIAAFDALNIFGNNPQLVLSSSRGDRWWGRVGANWSSLSTINTLPTPKKGHMQDISSVSIGERVFISAWVDNTWHRGIIPTSQFNNQEPLINPSKSADDYNWETVADLETQPAALPGWGPMQAFGEFTRENNLVQVYWRNNQEYMRNVPIGSGDMPDFGSVDAQPNKGFQRARSTENLPGTGSVHTITYNQSPEGLVQELIWRNNQRFSRQINPISINSEWTSVEYSGPEDDAALGGDERGSGIILGYNQLALPDQHPDWVAEHGTNQVPNAVQINAMFVTENDEFIGGDVKCVSRVIFGEQIEGDFNNDCKVDIYDYNFVIQHFGAACPNNQSFCPSTNQADLDLVIENYGNTCGS